MTQARTDLFELRVPPAAESVSVVRLFAAAVGAIAGCDPDMIEDIRLAVAESVTRAIVTQAAAGDDNPVFAHASLGPDGVAFEIESSAAGGASGNDGDLSLAVIRGLFPEVEVREGDRVVVRFSVPRAGIAHSH